MRLFVKDWRIAVLAVYAVVVGAMLLLVGKPGRIEWWPGGVGFWLFTLVPIALLCFGTRHVGIKGLCALVMAAGGLWGYYYAMFGDHANSTSALTFVVLPFYQLIGAIAFLLLLWLVDRFGKGGTE